MWCFSYAFRQIYNLCILLLPIFKYTSIGAFIIIFYAIFAISRFFYNHQIIHYSVFFSFAVSIERYIEKLHNERMRIDVDVTTILSQISGLNHTLIIYIILSSIHEVLILTAVSRVNRKEICRAAFVRLFEK